MSIEKMNEFFNKRAETYDDHMLKEMQLAEFYESIADCFPISADTVKLLDLGCGTGLELERLFGRMPKLSVTGIDLSSEMLNQLQKKFKEKNIRIICGSYFDVDFGVNKFDYALSTYSLHHFSEDEKAKLYKKVFNALKNGGIYIEGDYTCKTVEEQQLYLSENERLRKENGITDGFYHYDTPFTADTQMNLLKFAGFDNVELIKEWDSTSILAAKKIL